jgi:disulfide bond formation protein DsbB
VNFLSGLKSFSQSRLSWGLLFAFIIFFEACALFFQHVMILAPCVMCIYERIAMLGIGGAAVIGLIAPQNPLFRWIGLIAWGGSAYKGLMFEAYGDCSKVVWQFLSLSMPQWLVIIFAANLVALAVIILAQFAKSKR